MRTNSSTLKDIAKQLGVSVTTVYKALNNKPKVGDELRGKIIKIADELGYSPNRMAQALARKPLTITAIVPKYPIEFMSYMEQGIRTAFRELRSYNVIGLLEIIRNKEDAHKAWKSLYRRGVSGVVSCFNDYNNGLSDILGEMPGFDIPVVAITTVPRDDTTYIGKFVASGQCLGRMAGQFLGMIVGSRVPVACLIPDFSVDIHVNSVQGFDEEIRVWGLENRGVFFSGYDFDKTYQNTKRLFKEHHDLRGLYVGSSNAYPVCKCAEDLGLEKQICIIGHDLYPELVECIRKGTLTASLFQNQYDNAYRSVIALCNYLLRTQKDFQSHYYRPELVLKSNLDLYKGMY